MDKELTLEKLQIADRLTRLEATVEERWRNHNTGSNERARMHCEKLEELKKEIRHLSKMIIDFPCKEHGNEMGWIKGGMYAMYGVVFMIIATIVKLWMSKM